MPDQLFVNAFDDEPRGAVQLGGILFYLHRDALGQFERHLMAETNLQHQGLAAQVHAVAGAVDLQRFGEPLRDAMDLVGNERAVQAVQRTGPPPVVLAPDLDQVPVRQILRLQFIGELVFQFTQLAFELEVVAGRLQLDGLRHGYGLLSNPRHPLGSPFNDFCTQQGCTGYTG